MSHDFKFRLLALRAEKQPEPNKPKWDVHSPLRTIAEDTSAVSTGNIRHPEKKTRQIGMGKVSGLGHGL
jgi:hypothetical protein